jgi:hypothetical protein
VDAAVEHAAGLAGGSATALPWWDNWPWRSNFHTKTKTELNPRLI